ncbi:MAG: AraC-like DNA-binding protein [Cocleimonas sp.]|jgi:AraC-like DNA-binding protein
MQIFTAIFASIALITSLLLFLLATDSIRKKRSSSLSYKYLVVLSIVLFLQMVELLFGVFGLDKSEPILVLLVDPLTIALPFLVFGFLSTTKGMDAPNTAKQIWPHALPSIILFLLYIPLWLLSPLDRAEYVANFYYLEGNSIVNITPNPNEFLFIIGLLSLFYWWKLLQIRRNSRHSTNVVARLNHRLKLLMLFFGIGAIVLGVSGHRYATLMLLSMLASIFTSYCCYFFMLSSRVSFKSLRSTQILSTAAMSISQNDFNSVSSVTRATFVLLQKQMILKAYLDNELSLKSLADTCGVSTHLASQAINECSESNFYDWVNSYRIIEAKTLLETHSNINITKVAYNVGFNSKSTFYAAFKKSESLTPGEYRKKLLSPKK